MVVNTVKIERAIEVSASVPNGGLVLSPNVTTTAHRDVIVALMGDPISDGLVASISRPGGNLTGLSTQSSDLIGKRIEILVEAFSGLRRLAIIANVGSPAAVREVGECQAIAGKLDLEVIASEIRQAEDIAPAFETLKTAPMRFILFLTRLRVRTAFASTHWR